MSDINTENRKKLKNPHTAGKTSFAVVRSALEKEKNTSEPLSLREFFVTTRARKHRRSYKESDEDCMDEGLQEPLWKEKWDILNPLQMLQRIWSNKWNKG